MKSREEHIQFEMNYCQHYKPLPGMTRKTNCDAGMDTSEIQKIPTNNGTKWGPCIGGHLLEDATKHCPKWVRRTREMGEKRADGIERSLAMLTKVMPIIGEWRNKKPIGKQEVIECPVCKGKLHLSQASYNGHIRACCETKDCVNFIE